MLLDHAHNLQASLNQNASAGNNQTGFIAWQDVPVGAEQGALNFLTYGAAYFTMNGTVLQTLVAPPSAGWTREVTKFQLFNADNATDTLILQITASNNANNNSVFYKASMLTLANWVYEKGSGWKNQSAAGLSL